MKHSRREPARLSESDIERYSRQVIIPDIGAAGQAALMAATVGVLGDATGVAETTRYLRAAGVGVAEWRGQQDRDTRPLGAALERRRGFARARLDCVVVAGVDAVPADLLQRLAASGQRVVWYRIRAGGIRGGVRLSGTIAPWCEIGEAVGNPRDTSGKYLHAVAGCDAAAAAIAVVLGWSDLDADAEVQLA